MPTNADEVRVVEQLFEAMEAGPDGEEPMMALFADDAVLIESFTGKRREHRGKGAIRATYRELFREPPPPDMKLVLHRADRDGNRIRAEWSCVSSSYVEPRRGFDVLTVRDGKIQELEVCVTQAAIPMGGRE